MTRDISDVRDVARAYVTLLERGVRGEAYNVCTGVGVRLTDVVAALSARGGISGQALAEIEAFAADAPAWSRRNGGIAALPTQ